ncbi:MAG: hypothetical protein FJ030_08245 [Chloroflexi bacterium]|nr:hypothetical protein [Chloroflexota bacterium]
MEFLTQAQIICLAKLIAAYESERQIDHPAYQQAVQELLHILKARARTSPSDSGSRERVAQPQPPHPAPQLPACPARKLTY